jgi:NAD(P)-dependent dehydrogenase (short-subunit alcohol dehydrogenase family)
MNIAVIIGVGSENGLGGALCKRFATLGKHVFVAGRTQSKLDAIVSVIEANGGKATAHVTDCTDESQTQNLFDAACETGTVDAAIYNAGNNLPGRIIDMEADYFIDAWKICCFGGFLFGREALRRMQPNNNGTVLFTGASASMRGRAEYGAFNSSKAALRIFAQAMAKEAGPEGIHVGHVVVDGLINGDRIKERFPDHVKTLGEEDMINIESIVDAYEFLYKQPKTGWTFEVDLRTALENW